MSAKLIVFVKNKLMSIDTVLPILIEMKENYGVSSLIVVNDYYAHKGINENVVIKDAIKYVGGEFYIYGKTQNKVVKKVIKLWWLFVLVIKLIRGVKILHFGIFDEFPLNVVGKFFRKNIFFLQANTYAQFDDRFDAIFERNPVYKVPECQNIVSFTDAMPQLKLLNDNHKIFKFGKTRTRKSWVDYVTKRSNYYFDKYHTNIDFSEGCIVFILAFFGESKSMRKPSKSRRILFKKTIEVLDNLKGDIPVLMKPHVFTDLNIVMDSIRGRDGYHVTYLHPSVLATRARVFICNSFSTTMADGHSFGVKTVEYTDYNIDILGLTEGKSTAEEYIDVFINNDQQKFEHELQKIIHTSHTKYSSHKLQDHSTLEVVEEHDVLLDALARD